ncbi:MAG: AHH domain-containing protein [Planctomycetia bacterium]|nr:AHH domain-containing protein [Planctomycetia bacterium]
MVKAGIDRPAGTAAHHIVPAGLKKFQSAVDARNILTRFGISVENAANGVYLPSQFEDAVRAAYHGTLHSQRYFDEVAKRLKVAKSREEVLLVLNQIRKELLAGKFPH